MSGSDWGLDWMERDWDNRSGMEEGGESIIRDYGSGRQEGEGGRNI